MSEEKKNYQVLPGVYHGKAREYGPGSVVALTEKEAAPLLGFKVVLYDPVTAVPEPTPAPLGNDTPPLAPSGDQSLADGTADPGDDEEAAKKEAAALVAAKAEKPKK